MATRSGYRAAPFICLALITSLALINSPPRSRGQQGHQAPTPARPGATTGPAADVVTLNVSVTDDSGRYVTGLAAEAFKVYVDGKPQPILSFDDDAPASVGIIFDISRSMSKLYRPRSGGKGGLAEAITQHFFTHTHPSNEYFLIAFAESPQLLLNETQDADAVIRAVGKLTGVRTKVGRTALYDACYLGAERTGRGRYPKRAVVVITDGEDNASRYKYAEVSGLLARNNVLFYSVLITFEPRADPLSREAMMMTHLGKIATLSGGRAYIPESTVELGETVESIGLELRTQYSIGIRPTAASGRKDGWHKLKVEVAPVHDPQGKLMKFQARTRSGYYTPTIPL